MNPTTNFEIEAMWLLFYYTSIIGSHLISHHFWNTLYSIFFDFVLLLSSYGYRNKRHRVAQLSPKRDGQPFFRYSTSWYVVAACIRSVVIYVFYSAHAYVVPPVSLKDIVFLALEIEFYGECTIQKICIKLLQKKTFSDVGIISCYFHIGRRLQFSFPNSFGPILKYFPFCGVKRKKFCHYM